MLSIMRKHAQSWIIKVALGLIVVVFVFYFGVSRYDQPAAKLATVNGETITMEEYRDTYHNMLRRLQAQYGDMLNEQLLEAFNLKQQALDQLINERLLIQEAERLNFTVTPQEVARSIRSLPYFQHDGRFDQDLYFHLLRANRLEPADFERSHARSLLVNKVRDFITSNVVMNEKEALERFLFEREKVRIEYLSFRPEDHLAGVEAAAEEVEEFFTKNIQNYQVPSRIKVSYLLISPANFLDKVTITEDEVRDEYEHNLERYHEPDQVHARHILFRLDEDDQAREEEVRRKAEEVLAEARAGADFAELARKHSEDPGADNGGDLGFFARGMMVPEFEEAAFALKPGEIGDLVRSPFGYHIIKVEAIKKARTREFAEMREEIENTLKTLQAADLAIEKAEGIYEEIMQGRDFGSAGGEEGIILIQTDYFDTGQPIQGLEGETKAASTAVSLDPGEPSPVLDTSRGLVILKVDDRKPARNAELDEVREKVERDLKMEKASDLARQEAEKFRQILKNWKELPRDPEQEKFEIKTSEPFTRQGAITGIGFAPALTQAAFQLTEENRHAPEPVLHGGSWYLVRLHERIPATAEEFETERESYLESLARRKKINLLTDWLDQVRNRAKIEMFGRI